MTRIQAPLALIITVLSLTVPPVFAAPAAPIQASGDELICLGVAPGADVEPALAAAGATALEAFPGMGFLLVALPEGLTTEGYAERIALLESAPGVLGVELNSAKDLFQSAQGCVEGENPSVQQCTTVFVDYSPSSEEYASQEWLKTLGVSEAQALSAGGAVVVAVIDTGIDPYHPAFNGALFADGYDFTLRRAGGWDFADGYDSDGDGEIDEANGHGTHVAGTIVQLNPAARILPVRVLDDDGWGTAFDVALGIYYACFSGADVINLSLSLGQTSDVVGHAIDTALNLGIVVVTSAGNTGQERVLYPATHVVPDHLAATLPHGVVSVAAVDSYEYLAEFSAWGTGVDVSAPGVGIYAPYPDSTYAWWGGTSMACAVTSGIVSLGLSSAPYARELPVGELLIQESVGIDEFNPGREGGLGEGRIDALRLIQTVIGY